MDVDAYALASQVRSLIRWGSARSPRAQQKVLGASEVGHSCDRRLAYKVAGTQPVNNPDPLRALVGTGFHGAAADLMHRLNNGFQRFLIEEPIDYRGVPGTVDLYDRLEAVVYDWKTTTVARIKQLRHSGVPASYVVQLQIYAAALADQGLPIRAVALVYVPTDGTLDDLWVWRTNFDRSMADRAVDRLVSLGNLDGPAEAKPTPDRLCPWCPFYSSTSTNPALACPGNSKEN
jgi:hypothetical protein